MDNKNTLTKPDNINKAQAEFTPELSSVFNEMKNGIDIQPLDDIQVGDFIEFEDNVVEESSTDETNHSVEEPIKKKKRKKILPVIVSLIVIVSACIGIYIATGNTEKFHHHAVAVYDKNSVINIRLDNDEIIQLSSAKKTKLSDDGKTLIFSQDTASQSGESDILLIDFNKYSSVKNLGTVIATGVSDNWTTDSNCRFICYQKDGTYYNLKTDSNEKRAVAEKNATILSQPYGENIYYTVKKSEKTMLYRHNFTKGAEAFGEVTDVKIFSKNDAFEIFYTVPDSDGLLTLNKITDNGEELKISDKVSKVLFDGYDIGGNLYYLTANDSALSWNDFVQDSYADADATAKKPDKEDYMIEIGFLFGYETLDKTAYNKALENYNKALKRQEIRAALDKTDPASVASPGYNIKIYDGKLSKELARNVPAENIVSLAPTGTPRVIYKSFGSSSKILDINSLYNIAVSQTVNDAVNYFINCIKDSSGASGSYKYSQYDGNKVIEYDFKPKTNINNCEISFIGKNIIITAVKNKDKTYDLYINRLENKALGKYELLFGNVTYYKIESDKLIFKTTDDSLYVCNNQGKSTLICENSIQYFVFDNAVVALKGNYNKDVLTDVDIVSCTNEDIKTVDTKVNHKKMIIDGNTLGYIKTTGEFLIYTENQISSVDSDTMSIYHINY